MMALSNVRYLRQGGEGEAGATQAPLLFLALMVAWSSQSRVRHHTCMYYCTSSGTFTAHQKLEYVVSHKVRSNLSPSPFRNW